MSDPSFALVFVTALGCAVAAGVFYAFSAFVMAGLDQRSPATAVASRRCRGSTSPPCGRR